MSETNSGQYPLPYFQFDEFLGRQNASDLATLAQAHESGLSPSIVLVKPGERPEDFRRSLTMYDLDGIWAMFEPRQNSIVFFPSWVYHEVRPVRSMTDGLDGCRMTVNGWFHAVSSDAPSPALDVGSQY